MLLLARTVHKAMHSHQSIRIYDALMILRDFCAFSLRPPHTHTSDLRIIHHVCVLLYISYVLYIYVYILRDVRTCLWMYEWQHWMACLFVDIFAYAISVRRVGFCLANTYAAYLHVRNCTRMDAIKTCDGQIFYVHTLRCCARHLFSLSIHPTLALLNAYTRNPRNIDYRTASNKCNN